MITSSLFAHDQYDCEYCEQGKVPDITVGISVDYTFWTARQDGLITTLGLFSNRTSQDQLAGVDGGMTYPKWKFQSGFKVGLGFAINPWAMDSYIEYTWFYNRGNGLSPVFTWDVGTVDLFTVPKWFILVQAGVANPSNESEWITLSASSWNNQFNRLDKILSKSYLISRHFLYYVRFGLLGWWDTESLDVLYNDSKDPHDVIQVQGNQQGWGIGPYMGYGLEFYLYRAQENQVGFFADLGVGLFWSWFKATVLIQRESSTSVVFSDVFTQQNSKNVVWLTAPMLDADLGLRWMWWCTECFNLLIQVGWELQVWFDHNHMFSSFMTRGSGVCDALYTMQGLTVKVMFGF